MATTREILRDGKPVLIIGMVKDRGDEMTERLLEIKSECITSEIAKSFHIEQKKIINDEFEK